MRLSGIFCIDLLLNSLVVFVVQLWYLALFYATILINLLNTYMVGWGCGRKGYGYSKFNALWTTFAGRQAVRRLTPMITWRTMDAFNDNLTSSLNASSNSSPPIEESTLSSDLLYTCSLYQFVMSGVIQLVISIIGLAGKSSSSSAAAAAAAHRNIYQQQQFKTNLNK